MISLIFMISQIHFLIEKLPILQATKKNGSQLISFYFYRFSS